MVVVQNSLILFLVLGVKLGPRKVKIPTQRCILCLRHNRSVLWASQKLMAAIEELQATMSVSSSSSSDALRSSSSSAPASSAAPPSAPLDDDPKPDHPVRLSSASLALAVVVIAFVIDRFDIAWRSRRRIRRTGWKSSRATKSRRPSRVPLSNDRQDCRLRLPSVCDSRRSCGATQLALDPGEHGFPYSRSLAVLFVSFLSVRVLCLFEILVIAKSTTTISSCRFRKVLRCFVVGCCCFFFFFFFLLLLLLLLTSWCDFIAKTDWQRRYNNFMFLVLFISITSFTTQSNSVWCRVSRRMAWRSSIHCSALCFCQITHASYSGCCEEAYDVNLFRFLSISLLIIVLSFTRYFDDKEV
jgi:hypothetical protein